MNFQFWDLAAASAMFNTVQASTSASTQAHISPYAVRPSKIVKSSSNNSSPRALGRRRLTASGSLPARTRSVVDHQRAVAVPSYPKQTRYSACPNRPISWHPQSNPNGYFARHWEQDQVMSYHDRALQSFDHQPPTSKTTTTPNYGLATPASQPVDNGLHLHEFVDPLEDLSTRGQPRYGYAFDHQPEPVVGQMWPASQYAPVVGSNLCDHFSQQMNYPMPYDMPLRYPELLPTAATSPRITASYPTSAAVTGTDQTETGLVRDELVGMGLYDSPAEVQSSSLFLAAGLDGLARRKGLKLEDGFEPSSSPDETVDAEADADSDENDEDDGDDDDDAATADFDDELSAPAAQVAVAPGHEPVEMAASTAKQVIGSSECLSLMECNFLPPNWHHTQHGNGNSYGWF